MQKIDRWKLADELSVHQIALLLASYDPSEFDMDYYSQWPAEVKIEIAPYLNAVKNAARSKTFPAKIAVSQHGDELDCDNTLVEVDPIRGTTGLPV